MNPIFGIHTDLGAIPYDKAVLTVEAAALALVADDMHRVAGVI